MRSAPNGRSTALALLRHGPTTWTEDKRLQGHTDVSLSRDGRAQVATWSIPLEIRDYRLVSSPLRRAVETARLLLGRDPALEPRLKEMNWGRWEGRRLADLRGELGADMAANEARGLDFRPDGGESPREVLDRLQPWLVEIAAAGKPVLAVTHKSVIRALVARATGWHMTGKAPAKVRWGALQLMQVDAGGRLVVEGLDVLADEDA